MGRAIRGEVRTRWPRDTVFDEFFKVKGTGTAAIQLGSQYATLVDNGTGDYTLTFTYPGAQILGAVVTPIGATAAQAQIEAITKNEVTVLGFDLATPTAADIDFFLRVTVSSQSREY